MNPLTDLPEIILESPKPLPTDGFPIQAWCTFCDFVELEVCAVAWWGTAKVRTASGELENKLIPIAYKTNHEHTSATMNMQNFARTDIIHAHLLEFNPADVAINRLEDL